MINEIKYSSNNDNPDLEGTQASRSINVYFNDNISDDINDGKIVTTTKVNVIAQDDEPLLNVYNFERVQIAPINGELKVQETSLLPDTLIDEIGVDALSFTGYSDQSFVFDPDNLIQTIKISLRTVETDQSIIENALIQDKIIFTANENNSFVAEDNEKADIQITIPNEIIETQTLENNQSEVLQALRNLSYNNPESLKI